MRPGAVKHDLPEFINGRLAAGICTGCHCVDFAIPADFIIGDIRPSGRMMDRAVKPPVMNDIIRGIGTA